MKKQLGTGIVFLLLCTATVSAMSSTVFYGPVATYVEEDDPGFYPNDFADKYSKTLLSCMVFTDRGLQPWDSSFSLQGKVKQQLYRQGGAKAEEFEVLTVRSNFGDVVDLAVNKRIQSAKDIDYPCVDSQNIHVCVIPSSPLYSSDKGRISEITPLLPDSNLASTILKKAEMIINAFAENMKVLYPDYVFQKERTIIISVYGNGSVIRMDGDIENDNDSHFESIVFYINGDHIECVDNGKTSTGEKKPNFRIISVFGYNKSNVIYMLSEYRKYVPEVTNHYSDNYEKVFDIDSIIVK